ncbi:MAG: polysaccharide biosynthesis/export family protein [Phycisphaerae bacterium]
MGLNTRSPKALRAVMAAVALSGLTGCETVRDYLNLSNSFLNPSEVGRFDAKNPYGEVRPVKLPILEQLDVAEEPTVKWANAMDPTPADLIAEAKEYALVAGDAVNVSIFELLVPGQEYTKQLRINELGYINLQNVGNIQVGGLTPSQVEQKIAQMLIEQKILPAQPGPQVSVQLLESRAKVFSMLGAVARPGTYNILANDFRLLDAVAMGGDIPVQPGMDYIYIIRQGQPASATTNKTTPNGTAAPGGVTPPVESGTGGQSPIEDLNTLQRQTDTAPATETKPAAPASSAPAPTTGTKGPVFVRPLPTAMAVVEPTGGMMLAQADLDAALQPPTPATAKTTPATDVASVPATAPTKNVDSSAIDTAVETTTTKQAYIDGKWVNVGATQPATGAATTGVASGTGPATGTTTAGTQESEVSDGSTPQRVIKIPIGALREGVSKYNIVIRPGDVINVPTVEPGEFYMMGNIGRPGVYSLTGRKITLKQAVAAAGNLGPLAIPRRCDLIRRIGKDQEVVIQVNLQKVFDGEQPDIFLKPDDVVNIGTDMIAPFLAVTRNAYRASYGGGFVYDRNLNTNSNGG